MSPRRTNNRDGLNRSSSGNRLSLEPLQPHHDDHPLDDGHLHTCTSTGNGEHVSLDESENEGLPGALVTGARTSRARQNQHAVIDRHRRHRQEKSAQMTDDAAALISENQELRQQTMDLKLQLADAIAKIDELVQQNQQLMHTMQDVQDNNGNAAQAGQDEAYREYRQQMKPAEDTNNNSDQKPRNIPLQSFDRSLGYGQSNSRPSSYLSKSGGPLQALGGAASVRNMFSSLRGEAEVTNASSVVTSSVGKRSSLVSSRSSFYSARSMSSVSTSVRNDDSSQSISLHPDDLLRYGDHSNSNSIASIGHHQHQNHNNSGSVLESTPEEGMAATTAANRGPKDNPNQDGSTSRAPSWLQKLGALPVLNFGESAGSAQLDLVSENEDEDEDSISVSKNNNNNNNNNNNSNNLRRISRRGSNSAPNLHTLARETAPADPEREREKLAQSISQSTLKQFHGSMLDLMALAPSKLAEVTMEKEEEQHVMAPRPDSVGSVQRTTNRNYGKPLNAGDHFEVPLRAEKSNADAAEGEDGGMKRNNTDKDVNDFFRRMSGAMSDDESDARDLAGGGDNANWDDLADRAKRLNTPDKSGTKNDFAAMADKLIADSTFDLYK